MAAATGVSSQSPQSNSTNYSENDYKELYVNVVWGERKYAWNVAQRIDVNTDGIKPAFDKMHKNNETRMIFVFMNCDTDPHAEATMDSIQPIVYNVLQKKGFFRAQFLYCTKDDTYEKQGSVPEWAQKQALKIVDKHLRKRSFQHLVKEVQLLKNGVNAFSQAAAEKEPLVPKSFS
ncbi:MAG: hypothetical protein ACPGUD_09475 [Parashewanella sp.]